MKKIIVFILMGLVCAAAAQVPTSGLIGSWEFSGNANDGSGSGNNGTVFGASLIADRCGNPNSAYSFNGTSDYIQMLNPGPTGNASRSLSFWAKTATITVAQSVFSYGSSGTGAQFQVNYTGPPMFCQGVAFDESTQAFTYPNSCIFNNQWHHIVATFNTNGNQQIQSMIFYIDGVQQPPSYCTMQGTGNLMNTGSSNPISISVPGRYFQGEIDDIYLYNRVLTPAEVHQLFSICTIGISGNTNICPNTTNNYTATPVVGASNYTWILPNGWTGTSSTNTISATANFNSGIISVSAGNSCGQIITQTLAVTVPSSPNLSIVGNSIICSGVPGQLYQIVSNVPLTGITWTLPQGWTSSPLGNDIYATANINSGVVTVTGSACGNTFSQSMSVTLLYPQPMQTVSGPTLVCPNTSYTYTALPVPGTNGYNWNIPVGWTNNSTINTNTVSVTSGNNPGIITVSALGICGFPVTQTLGVKVHSPQSLTITGLTSICPNSTNTYTANVVTGAASYTWSLPGGWTGTSTTNIITITADSSPGSISVMAFDLCGNSITQNLVINMITPQTGLNISGSILVCPNSTYGYTASAVNSASNYSWTLPGSWTGTSSGPIINITSSTNSGTITVSATDVCGVVITQTLAVAVISLQTFALAASQTTVCPGEIINNITTGVPQLLNGELLYWSQPAGWPSTNWPGSTVPWQGWGLTNITAGSSSGIVTMTVINACGSTGINTLAITVLSPQPTLSLVGNTLVCPNSTHTYTTGPLAGTYSWNLSNGGWSGNSTTNTISVTFNSTGGAITASASNGCSIISQSLPVTIIPTQTGLTISGTTLLCAGSVNLYTAGAVNGATSYTWTLPGGWSGTSATSALTATAGSSSGVISVSAIDLCGILITQTLAVNIIPVQTGLSINGNGSVCPNSSASFTAATVNGASSYSWNLPTGWTIASSPANINIITASTGINGGVISVSALDVCGNLITQTLAVTIINPQTNLSISGNTLACFGIPNGYTATPVTGAVSYTWSLPPGWPSASSGSVMNTSMPGAAGVISVSATDGCGVTLTQTLAVSVFTTQYTSSISGPTLVCAGSVNNYTAGVVNTVTSYSWANFNGPLGGSSTTTLINITAPSTSPLEILYVEATDICGITQNAVLLVTVILPQTTLSISGSTLVCPNTTNSYTAGAVTGATSYTWSLPGGWTGTSNTTLIAATAGLSSGILTVSATNTCGTIITQTLDVTVVPTQTNLGISGNTLTCVGNQNSYTATPVAGAAVNGYTWTFPGSWVGSSNTNIITFTMGLSATTISVSAFNGCTVVTQILMIGQHGNCCPQTSIPVLSNTLLTAGGSLSGPLIIDQDVTITGSGNFTLQTGDFLIANSVTITVQPGANLVLSDAHLNACNLEWRGIVVQDGANVTSSPGPLGLSTLIENAMLAVDVSNISATHAVPLLDLDGVIFNRNWECIRISNSTLTAIPLGIRSCVFTNRDLQPGTLSWPSSSYVNGLRSASSTATATSLSPPYLNNYPFQFSNSWGFSMPLGIRIDNIDNVNGGTPAAGVSWGTGLDSEFNLFDYMRACIYVTDASLTTYNNTFQNFGVTGIRHATSLYMNARLSLTPPQPTVNAVGNRFWNNYFYAGLFWGGNWATNGIIVEDILEFDIEEAIFRGWTSNPNGGPGSAISVRSSRFNNYNIRRNTFSNEPTCIDLNFTPGPNFYGVSGYSVNGTFSPNGIYGGTMDISENIFSPLPPLSTVNTTTETIGLAIYIFGDNTAPWNTPCLNGNNVVTPNYVQSNTITLAENGIFLSQMTDYPLGIIDNYIDLNYALKRLNPNSQWGIFMGNTLGHKTIRSNYIQSTGFGWNNLTYPVYCAYNVTPEITCNTVKNGYNGFYFSGNNQGVWSGNIMDNNDIGLHLDGASTMIGQPNMFQNTTGNQWINNITDTWVDAPSVALASPLYINLNPNLSFQVPTNNIGAGTQPYNAGNGSLINFNWWSDYECPSSQLLLRGSVATGIGEEIADEKNGIDLSPNPTSGNLLISGLQENETSSVTISEIAGKVLFSKKLENSESHQIDISSFANGIYLVEVQSTSNRLVKKIVLAK